jgi:hypothetical protein
MQHRNLVVFTSYQRCRGGNRFRHARFRNHEGRAAAETGESKPAEKAPPLAAVFLRVLLKG